MEFQTANQPRCPSKTVVKLITAEGTTVHRSAPNRHYQIFVKVGCLSWYIVLLSPDWSFGETTLGDHKTAQIVQTERRNRWITEVTPPSWSFVICRPLRPAIYRNFKTVLSKQQYPYFSFTKTCSSSYSPSAPKQSLFVVEAGII